MAYCIRNKTITEDGELDNIVPYMEQIDANDLLIFARVADQGSFSRAAKQLGLPRSTVSRRITQLEETLGERLMLRTTRQLRLTDFGEHLLTHARQVAAEVEAAAALSEQRRARPTGRLRVSMPSDIANLLLADSLAAFAALHPHVQLELDLSPRRVDLIGENFDLAVRMGELPDDNLLVARRLGCFTFSLYAAPTYLAEHGTPASPAALLDHDALYLPDRNGQVSGWQLQQQDQHWHGQPRARITANSPETLIHLARAGAGIAAVPDALAQPALHRGELRRVLPGWQLPSPIAWAVYPGRRLLPARTHAFLAMLEAATAHLGQR